MSTVPATWHRIADAFEMVTTDMHASGQFARIDHIEALATDEEYRIRCAGAWRWEDYRTLSRAGSCVPLSRRQRRVIHTALRRHGLIRVQ